MMSKKFSVYARLQSFVFAFNGIRVFLQKEHNAWIHLLATVAVLIAGFLFNIRSMEWIAVVFSIGLVWVAEILNTCIEQAMDLISVEKDPKIKVIKDMAAGAVLVAALIAFVVALFVFIPYLKIM